MKMKHLNREAFDRARHFLKTQARPLERAMFEHRFEAAPAERVIAELAPFQNDDGGFGPWKNHPVGSDPWSTGIVLLGLLSYPGLVKKEVIERAVSWLDENQLPNGLWAYHYIEEGSAYAYWGLVEALKYLARKSN